MTIPLGAQSRRDLHLFEQEVRNRIHRLIVGESGVGVVGGVYALRGDARGL